MSWRGFLVAPTISVDQEDVFPGKDKDQVSGFTTYDRLVFFKDNSRYFNRDQELIHSLGTLSPVR